MEKIVNVSQMKKIDMKTIEEMKIPSLVLIENAANTVVSFLEEKYNKNTKFGIFAGPGNNGADAICVARILTAKKYKVDLYVFTKESCSIDCKHEIEIAQNFQVNFSKEYQEVFYDVIIDGIFGIGLNRKISGTLFDWITYMNESNADIVSLDIPSGIDGDNGSVLGIAICADFTITFSYKKIGMFLNEAPNYVGEIICKDIGLFQSNQDEKEYLCSYLKTEKPVVPSRITTGNKGTFGKLLIFSGCKDYGGAVSLVTLAAFRTGCGMVHVITHSENRKRLLEANPEAMVTCYDEAGFSKRFSSALSWADVIVAGPGIGLNEKSREILEKILGFVEKNKNIPFILDADALMILKNKEYQSRIFSCKHVICTPHVKEFSDILNVKVIDVKENMVKLVSDFSAKWNLITVCKDAKTFVFDGKTGKGYINQSGNDGMATAGSGDVLAGIIAALISQGMHSFAASYTAVHIHGLAGDLAQNEYKRGLIASDIINSINNVF